MFKLIKLIIFIAINAVIAFGLYAGYDLWRNDELTQDNLKKKLEENYHQAKGQVIVLADKTSVELKKLNAKLKEEYDQIDWQEVRQNLKISETDLEEYKNTTKWAYEEVSTLGDYDYEGMANEEVEDYAYTKPPAGSNEEKSNPVVQEKPVSGKNETNSGDTSSKTNVSKTKPKPEANDPRERPKPVTRPASSNQEKRSAGNDPNIAKKKAMIKEAEAKLAKAKQTIRKAKPGSSGYQRNLKAAVRQFEDAQKSYKKMSRSPYFTKRDKQNIERTMEKIQKQIYWGNKLGGL